ncbi:hypothetical protein [Microcystis aeruginosa]|uniref:hypothetical protein n=1 Tax=Microcystis aeruginosa TaxID=1126 RepID=UPI0007763847|nr:hypothetical protein [Microcystis aeruginosa]KXS91916.1 hypothetical protein OA58_08890 [Microcystis aeruginosa NIES-88]BCU10904.1 hypothetical protein MAN88_14680 [Microcystis aeruginosa]
MATRTLGIKYTSEGLAAVTGALQKVSFAFDEALSKAQDTVEEAIKASQEALKVGDAEAFAEAEKKKALAAKQTANLVKNAYRELGVQSEADIKSLKEQAVSAFEAIKNSGVASARDIADAQKQLDRRLEQLNAQLKDSSNRWGRVTESISGAKLALSSFVGNLAANTVTGAFTSITGSITAFFGGLSANIQRAGIQTENLKAQLKTIEGSAAAAEAAYAKIAKFAQTTPYELEQVTAAYVSLANRGMKPTEEQLQAIGDMAASQQKPLQQYVEAILDAMTGENERLKEFGIKAAKSGDQVSFTFRGITKTVQATEKSILDTLLSLSKMDGVMGGMNERAKTTEGKLSNLTDALQAVYVKLFNAIMPAQQALIEASTGIIAPLAQQEDLYKAIGDRAKELSDYLKANPQIIEEIRRQLQEGMLLVFNSVSATAKQILDYLRANPTAIEDAIKAMGTLLNITKELVNVLGFVLKGYQAIADTVRVINQEMPTNKLISPADVAQQIKAAGGSDADVQRVLKRIEKEASDLSIVDTIMGFNTDKIQSLVMRILEEELKLLKPDYGPLTRGASLKFLPVPTPPPSRSGASVPPSPGASTPSSGSSGSKPKSDNNSRQRALIDAASKIGIKPEELAALISFETGGTFNPDKVGGEGNRYRGLIQFGPPERRQFGVYPGQSFEDQMNSVVAYFRARGFKPGMGLLRAYATVLTGNANGNVHARDSNGTSAFSAVQNQIGPGSPHWQNALRFLGGASGASGAGQAALARVEAQLIEAEKAKKRAEQQAQLAREVAKLTQLIGGNVSKIALPQNLFGEITPPPEFMGMRLGSSTVGAGIPSVNLDLFLATLTKNQEAIEAATEALKLGIERFATATLPSFGEITPPPEFEGFSFGSSTVGVDALVTYPDRIIEMAENARLAMERLDDMVAVFAETGTVGVEKLATGFENLGKTVTDVARDAFGQFFRDVLTGQKSVGDALLDLLSSFLDNIANMFASIATNSLFNWIGGLFGGGGGFSFGGLFNGGGGGIPDIFGGGATFSTMALPGFAKGGRVFGSPGIDKLVARLSDGEFVITADAADYWGDDFLNSVNSKKLPDLNFTSSANPQKNQQNTTIINNNVSVSTPDPGGFKRSERQIGRQLSEYSSR